MDQQQCMQRLASQIDEWGQLYPGLCQLAAIALVIPVSTVNCELQRYEEGNFNQIHCYFIH